MLGPLSWDAGSGPVLGGLHLVANVGIVALRISSFKKFLLSKFVSTSRVLFLALRARADGIHTVADEVGLRKISTQTSRILGGLWLRDIRTV